MQPVVVVLDRYGNCAASAAVNVTATLAIATVAGVSGAMLPMALVGGRTVLSCRGAAIAGADAAVCDCGAAGVVCCVARYTDLVVAVAGAYFLNFSSDGLVPITSARFEISAGRAYALQVDRLPAGCMAGAAFDVQPAVAAVDRAGNAVPAAVGTAVRAYLYRSAAAASAALAAERNLSADPLATLSGAATVGVDGVADFVGLAVAFRCGDCVFAFDAGPGLLPVATAAFVVASPPVALASTWRPSTAAFAAGAHFAVTVVAVDRGGLPSDAVGRAGQPALTVSAALCTPRGGGGSTAWACGAGGLLGNSTAALADGTASFTNLGVGPVGTFALQFKCGVLSFQTASFVVALGPPARLAVFQDVVPVTAAGFPFARQPAVIVVDIGGNIVVTDSSSVVTAALLGQDGVAAAAGAITGLKWFPDRSPRADVARGVAWFDGLWIDAAGGGYRLRFLSSLPAVTFAESNAFAVVTGPPLQLTMAVEPSGCSAGAPGSGGVAVCVAYPSLAVQDRGGNPAMDAVGVIISAALVNATTSASVVPQIAVAASAIGIAAWTELQVGESPPGAGYALIFASAGLNPIRSRAFPIAATASALFLASGAEDFDPGAPAARQPAIAIVDAGGVLVEAAGSAVEVAASLLVGSGSSARPAPSAWLAGTTVIAAMKGTATFTNLRIDTPGACYTLRFRLTAAYGSALGPITTAPFAVLVGASVAISVVTQPYGAVPGQPFQVQPAVALLDAGGNLASAETATLVTASILGQPPDALQGWKVLEATGGLTQFVGLRADGATGCMRLIFSCVGRTPALSDAVPVLPLSAVALGVITEPAGAVPGRTFATQPLVIALDGYGNAATSAAGAAVQAMLLLDNAPAECQSLGPCLLGDVNAIIGGDGIARFTNLRIDRAAGSNYSLLFTCDGLAPVVSIQCLQVRAAATAVALGVVHEPGGFAVGFAFARQPVVAAVDAGGNIVHGAQLFVVSVELLGSRIETVRLSGGLLSLSTSGVATFTDLSVGGAAANLTLRFSVVSGEYGSIISQAFDVPVNLSNLTVIVQPSECQAGLPCKVQPVVGGRDILGRAITWPGVVQNVTVRLVQGELPLALQGTTEAQYTIAGFAIFTDLRLDTVLSNSSYRFNFSCGSFFVISEVKDALPGSATVLHLVQSSIFDAVALKPLQPQPVVKILDAYGNVALQALTPVTAAVLSLNSSSNKNALLGTSVAIPINGVASFTDLACKYAYFEVILIFTAPTLQATVSSQFEVKAGLPARLVFRTVPQRFFVGRLISPQPSLAVLDSVGNVVQVDGNVSVELLNATGCLVFTENASYTSPQRSMSGQFGASNKTSSTRIGCSVPLPYLSLTQGFCLSDYLNDKMVLCCTAALFANQATGSLVVTDLDGSNGTIYWNLISKWYISGNVITYNVSSTVYETTNNAECKAVVPSSVNVPAYIHANSSFIQNQSQIRALVGRVGLSLRNLTVSVKNTLSSGGKSACGTSGLQEQALLAGSVEFHGLIIIKVLAAARLRFSFGSLQVETDDFSVSSDPAYLSFVQPGSTSADGGMPLSRQPSIGLFDSMGYLVTYYDYIATATLVADDGLESCKNIEAGFQFRCPEPVSICAYSAELCPRLMGNSLETSAFGVAEYGNLAITSCNDAEFSSDEKYSCIRGQYNIIFQAIIPGWTNTLTLKSPEITINIGSVAVLNIEINPSQKNIAGQAFVIQPLVVLLDGGMNRITTRNSIVAQIMDNISHSVSSNLLLGGHSSIIALDGVAIFTDLSAYSGGPQYFIVFSLYNTAISVYSSVFSVGPAKAFKLDVLIQPSVGFGGEALQIQPVVQITDAWSNRVTYSNVAVNVTATLVQASDQSAILIDSTSEQIDSSSKSSFRVKPSLAGLIAYSSLGVDRVGYCYSLLFSAPALVYTVSETFDVTEGSPFRLVVDVSPSGIAPGYIFQVQPSVSVQDRGGNVNENRYVGDLIASLVSSETNTTLQQRVLALPAVLKGTVLASAQRGVALWSDLRVDSVGQFRLCFQPLYGAMQLSLSNLFEVQTGPPVMLAVLIEPAISVPGRFLATQPVISVQDAAGNQVHSSGVPVRANLFQNGIPSSWSVVGPPCTAFHCSWQCSVINLCDEPTIRCPTCTNVTDPSTALSVNGSVVFQYLAVEAAGQNFSIRFESTSLLAVDSVSFSVYTGKSMQIRVLQQPLGFLSGAIFLVQPWVSIEDIGNNTLDLAGTVSVRLASLNQSDLRTLLFPLQNLNISFLHGKAKFVGLGIRGVGGNLHLIFTSSSCNGHQPCLQAISESFNVTSQPSQLKIIQNPVGSNASLPFAMQPIVCVVDSNDMVVNSDFNTAVSCRLISPSKKNANLSGNTELTCQEGICIFTDLSIDTAAMNYTLFFDAYLLNPVYSTVFSVNGPSMLQIFQEPGGSIAGKPFFIQPAVRVVDNYGNVLPSNGLEYEVKVQRREGSGPVEGNLYGTTSIMTINGSAYFSDLWLEKVGSQYVLTFFSDPLTYSDSIPFDTELESRQDFCSNISFVS